MTSLRELWDEGRVTVGGWCVMPGAFGAELTGRCGYEWVCVDTQNGVIGYDQMAAMVQALGITGTTALVRVAGNHPVEIMKPLDAGAQGVVVPMVNSAEEARQAVAASRYPPEGYRSWGPLRAALDVPGYSPENANRRTVVAVMLESAAALQAADEILSVPGVDAALVGVVDAEAGLVEHVLAACQRHGVVPGIRCESVETALRWVEMGFRMLSVGSDASLMGQGAGSVVNALKGAGATGSSAVG